MSLDLADIKKKSKSQQANSGGLKQILDFLNKDLSFGKKGLKDQKKEQFYSELNILLTSGTDVRTAMDIIVAEQTKKKEKMPC